MVRFSVSWVTLVCFGFLCERPRAVDSGCAAAASLAAQFIGAGTSIADTTIAALKNDGYRVTCIIEVENWTNYSLAKPEVRIHRGVIKKNAPRIISPAKREVMTSHNAGGWYATGTWGTVSWFIEGLNRRVYVMWSAPFNFDFYSNWLAVGLSQRGFTGHPSGNTAFNAMYYGDENKFHDGIGFRRREYYRGLSPVEYSDADIKVVGRMSNGHEAVVEIDIVPVRSADLAPGIPSMPCFRKK